MFGNIGATEIIVIAVVALLLFGPKKLPEMMQSVGKGIKEFKKSLNEVEEEIKNSIDDKK
ncbi:MAG: twin-arginine translocase TatA/TatE family subunit [Ignavibacteriaceae bacterium]|jgi:sec-independent protein translocase protein TatA|nr:twin-arginine translocase TatA/TatE family subunit [Ignavibacteriaceae bacterium]